MNAYRSESASHPEDAQRAEYAYGAEHAHRSGRPGLRNLRPAALPLLAGVGLGAALMYFLDPSRGAWRRSLVRDQAGGALRTGRRQFQRRAEDLQHRAAGAVAEMRARLQEEEVADEQLVARVRAQLGHHVRHARPIEVSADRGVVTLRGPVLRTELGDVLRTVQSVRGVERVNAELEVHEVPGGVAALQH